MIHSNICSQSVAIYPQISLIEELLINDSFTTKSLLIPSSVTTHMFVYLYCKAKTEKSE